MPENPIPPKVPQFETPEEKPPVVQQGPKMDGEPKVNINLNHELEDNRWILPLVFGCVALAFLILGEIWGFLDFLAIILGVVATILAVMNYKNEKRSIISLVVAIVALAIGIVLGGSSLVYSIYDSATYDPYNYDYNYDNGYHYDHWDYWD